MAMTGGTAKLVKTSTTSVGTTLKLYVYYKTTQNIEKNKSTIYCGMYITISAGSIGSWTDSNGSYLGTTSNTFTGTIPYTNGVEEYWIVEDKSFTVNHNADGTGSATIYWKWGVNSSWGGMVKPSGSFTITLPKIPRASSITSAGDITLGNKCSIKWTPASKDFKYKLKFSLGTWNHTTGLISPGITSAYTYTGYTIPANETLYKLVPKATGKMSVTLATYDSDGKKIGSTSEAKTFTVTVPSSVKPKISSDAITLTPHEYDVLIHKKNKLTVSIDKSKCSAAVGSTIQSYTFSGVGISYTGTNASVTSQNNISASETDNTELTYKVTVTDTRERTASQTKKITCYAYSAPKFRLFEAYRVGAKDSTEQNDNGAFIYCTYEVIYSRVNGSNSIKEFNISSTKGTIDALDPTWELTNGEETVTAIGKSWIDLKGNTTATFNIFASVADQYSTSYAKSNMVTVSGAARVLNITSDGTGVAFGKMAESNNLFESKYKIKAPGITSSRGTRPVSANIVSDTNYTGCLEYYLASSAMTEGRPTLGDGHILHFHWDNTSGVDSQLYLRHRTGEMMSRGCDDGTWGNWRTHLDSENYTSYVSKKPILLFSGTNAGTITITLDSGDSLDSYSYLEFFYTAASGNGHSSDRVYNPNGKRVHLSVTGIGDEGTTYINRTAYNITGNANIITITPNIQTSGRAVINNTTVSQTLNNNYIKIVRVLGYK